MALACMQMLEHFSDAMNDSNEKALDSSLASHFFPPPSFAFSSNSKSLLLRYVELIYIVASVAFARVPRKRFPILEITFFSHCHLFRLHLHCFCFPFSARAGANATGNCDTRQRCKPMTAEMCIFDWDGNRARRILT